MTKTKPKAASTSITVENVDDEQLAQAASMLGTESPQDTVNQALKEVVRLRMIGEYVALMKRSAPAEFEDPRTTAWQSPTT